MNNKQNQVHVSAYSRGKQKVSAHTRGFPGYGDGVGPITNPLKSLSAAGMQGLSLGWSDEIHGAIGGFGYGVGSLNSNWNKNNESFSKAFERGYIKTRDRHRNLLEEGSRKYPLAMAFMESAGAIASPTGNFLSATKTAPLSIKSKTTRNGALITGGIYGAGVSKNNSKDYAKNIVIGASGNIIGYGVTKKLYGRAGAPISRGIVGEATNYGFKKAINLLENKK